MTHTTNDGYGRVRTGLDPGIAPSVVGVGETDLGLARHAARVFGS